MKPATPEIDKADPVVAVSRIAILGPIAAHVAFVMELTLMPLLLPAIQLQFDLSIGQLAWVFNSYGIAVAIGVILGGWSGDAFNTRKVFGFGVAFFATGSLLVATTESYEALIIGRALQGFGSGIFSPLVPILLTRASPQRPGRTLIIWGSVAGYVAAFAPLFYGSFLDQQSWNLGFFMIAAIALIALGLLNKAQAIEGPKADHRGRANYSEFFRAGDLWVTFVYVFCTYGSITYYLFRLPIWLSSNEVTTASVGFILSIMWLTFSGTSTLLRNLVDRHHVQTIMLAAPVLIAFGLPLSYYNENLLLLIASAVLVGAGLACSNAPSTQLILRFAPNGMSGVATSLDITFARLGGIATVAILAQAEVNYAAPAIGLLCLVAAFCALKVCRGTA